MLNAIKYTRKKIREGTLDEWKVEQFWEIEGMRDMGEHTGGRKIHSTGLGANHPTQPLELLLDL